MHFQLFESDQGCQRACLATDILSVATSPSAAVAFLKEAQIRQGRPLTFFHRHFTSCLDNRQQTWLDRWIKAEEKICKLGKPWMPALNWRVSQRIDLLSSYHKRRKRPSLAVPPASFRSNHKQPRFGRWELWPYGPPAWSPGASTATNWALR